MRLVGLTGGIATGKSTFSALLRERGVPVLDADALARAAVAPGTAELAEIARAFGPEMISPDGTLDRRRMAATVFADARARRRLEAIVHPAVRRLLGKEAARLEAQGHAIAFYDVPLLFEVGLEADLDCVVVVRAPRAAQRERLVRRDGLDPDQAEARISAQMDVDEKAARADFVVENAGPPGALAEKADRLLADLGAGRGRRLPNEPPVRY